MKIRHVAAAVVAVAALAAALPAAAHAEASRETVTAMVGGQKVSIEYGRPVLKDRKVADLLAQLSAERVWRTGVDQITTVTIGGDILVGSARVPAGKYSIYVHAPQEGSYSLLLNSDPGVPLKEIFAGASPERANLPWPRMSYSEVKAKEVARAPLASTPPAAPVDMFTIKLAPKGAGATLNMAWGDQGWSLDLLPVPAK